MGLSQRPRALSNSTQLSLSCTASHQLILPEWFITFHFKLSGTRRVECTKKKTFMWFKEFYVCSWCLSGHDVARFRKFFFITKVWNIKGIRAEKHMDFLVFVLYQKKPTLYKIAPNCVLAQITSIIYIWVYQNYPHLPQTSIP